MTDAIRIFREPTGTDHSLAIVLIGLTIRVRPALRQLTDDPTIGANAHYIFLGNADIREAIARATIGSERVEGFYPQLPLGRATWIPRDCCYEIEHQFAPPDE